LVRSGATYDIGPDVGSDVLDRVDEFLARFIVYPDIHACHAHALWIAHCWLMDVWRFTPRLLFVSPEAGCGKTSALEITSYLVPRPDFVGDLTPAGLYYSIDESIKDCGSRPTMLYDEVDTVFRPGRDAREMRRLIDIGHDRRATVKRKMRTQTEEFQVFTAMAMAGLMAAADVPSTIRTRSVVVQMQPPTPDEKKGLDRWDRDNDGNRRTHPPEVVALRDLVALWVEFVHEQAHEHFPRIPDEVGNRDADVWEPLLTVAELAGGRWPEMARVAAVAVVAGSAVSAEPSRGVRLLWDIRAVFDEQGTEKLFTEKLLGELKRLDESPWESLKPITMAKLLKPYGVTPEDQRIGETVRRGYQREYFRDAWLRFPPPKPATPAIAATPGTV
jgi:hypothetical protein